MNSGGIKDPWTLLLMRRSIPELEALLKARLEASRGPDYLPVDRYLRATARS